MLQLIFSCLRCRLIKYSDDHMKKDKRQSRKDNIGKLPIEALIAKADKVLSVLKSIQIALHSCNENDKSGDIVRGF